MWEKIRGILSIRQILALIVAAIVLPFWVFNFETYLRENGLDRVLVDPWWRPVNLIDTIMSALWSDLAAGIAIGAFLFAFTPPLFRLLIGGREQPRLKVQSSPKTGSSKPVSAPLFDQSEEFSNSKKPLSYPYRKAVLQMGKPQIYRSNSSSGDLENTACVITIKNHSQVRLKECCCFAVALNRDSVRSMLNSPVRAGPNPTFTLDPKGPKQLTLIFRDFKDVVSKPPFILKLANEDYPLPENMSARLELELRSEYEHPTKVLLGIVTGQHEQLKVKILDQSV